MHPINPDALFARKQSSDEFILIIAGNARKISTARELFRTAVTRDLLLSILIIIRDASRGIDTN